MQNVPLAHASESEHRRRLADAINILIPVVKSVTFTLSSATTTVTDERMGADKTVLMIPTDTGSSTETWFLSSKLNGSFVITHTNSAATRTFDYIIIG